MTLELTPDALFTAAAAGSIPTISSYFAQDLLRAELAQANETSAVSETFKLCCWYRMNPDSRLYKSCEHFLFGVAIKHGQVAVIEWLFSPERAGCFDAVLAALLPNIGCCAMQSSRCGLEVLEIILSSKFFRERLPAARQEKFLVKMLFLIGDSVNEAAREILIAHGASVNGRASDRSLRRALDICHRPHRYRPTEHESPLIKLLLANGVHLVDADMLSCRAYLQYPTMSLRLLAGISSGAEAAVALTLAARLRETQVLRYLLEKGFVDVDARGVKYETPLIAATQCITRPSCLPSSPLGSPHSGVVLEMVQLFLDYGADHSLTDKDGKTCLEHVVEQSHARTVQLLIQRGADPNAASSGRCLLEVALVRPGKVSQSMVPVLLRHGADPSLVTLDGRSFCDLLRERDDGQAFMDTYVEYFSRKKVPT